MDRILLFHAIIILHIKKILAYFSPPIRQAFK